MNESARNLEIGDRPEPFKALKQMEALGWIESTDGWLYTLVDTVLRPDHVANTP
jgi:hypothetical protein